MSGPHRLRKKFRWRSAQYLRNLMEDPVNYAPHDGDRDLSVLGAAAVSSSVQSGSKSQLKCTSTVINSTTAEEGEDKQDPANHSTETPEEKTLRLDETFKKIIYKLTLPDLKTARLVAVRWNDTVYSEVLRLSVVRLKYKKEQQQYVQLNAASEQSPRSLGDLVECLKRSSNFPVSDFGFIGGNMGTANANKFFRDHGGRVKTLFFDVGTNIFNLIVPGHKSSWRTNLIYNAPLIEHMDIDYLVPELEELHIVLPFDPFRFRECHFPGLFDRKVVTAFGVSLKIKPPFCDPNILRLIKVIVVRKAEEEPDAMTGYSRSFNFVSWITEIYHLMPNLKVILTYDQTDVSMVNILGCLPSFITIE